MRRTTKANRRTTKPKNEKKPRRTALPGGAIHIPTYTVGDIIMRLPFKTERYLIADCTSQFLSSEPKFILIHLGTGTLLSTLYTPKHLALFDYVILKHIEQKEIDRILGVVHEEVGTRVGSNRKLLRKAKKKRKVPKTYLGHCNEGFRVRLTKRMETVGGRNPLISGTKVHMKGSRVLNVKAYCPDCGRPCTIKYSKRDKAYILGRHKAPKSKRQRKEKKQRRRTTVVKRRRTT